MSDRNEPPSAAKIRALPPRRVTIVLPEETAFVERETSGGIDVIPSTPRQLSESTEVNDDSQNIQTEVHPALNRDYRDSPYVDPHYGWSPQDLPQRQPSLSIISLATTATGGDGLAPQPSMFQDFASTQAPSVLNSDDHTIHGHGPQVLRSSPVSLGQNWRDLHTYCKGSDDMLLQKWDDEINSLLVYAGLFSAVVTAFVLESYQLLQPDPNGSTVTALATMSEQLQVIASGGGPTPIYKKLDNSRDSASASAVALNALWLLSLIAALSSASAAIVLKQAFREFKTWSNVPRTLEALQLRQLRHHAFQRWQVPAVAAFLPASLSVSTILFMTGLPLFVWNLNATLTVVITATVGLFLIIALAVGLLPLVVFEFPYKSPVSWGLLKAISWVKATLRLYLHRNHHTTVLDAASWQDRDLRVSRMKATAHLWDLIQWLCSSWSDHRLAPAIHGCVSDLTYKRHPPNYIDIVKRALPNILNMDRDVLAPTLVRANDRVVLGQPGLVERLFPHSHHLATLEQVRTLRYKLSEVPWKLLALLHDEIVKGLRQAAENDFSSPIYAERDRDKSFAVAGLCFLDCLMERAKGEFKQSKSVLDQSLTTLVYDLLCLRVKLSPSGLRPEQSMTNIHIPDHTDILESIALTWAARDPDISILNRNHCLHLMFAAGEAYKRIMPQSQPKPADLRLFSTLTSLALKVAAAKDYMNISQVFNAFRRLFPAIEAVIRLSVTYNVKNCGMHPPQGFPWSTILTSHAHFLSPDCKEDLLNGFNSGIFVARIPSQRDVLLQALRTQSSTTAFEAEMLRPSSTERMRAFAESPKSTLPPALPLDSRLPQLRSAMKQSKPDVHLVPLSLSFSAHSPSHLVGLHMDSAHQVKYEDQIWPTAAHLLESMKFLPIEGELDINVNQPDLGALADLRQRISRCETPRMARDLSAGAARCIRADWDEIATQKADDVLWHKLTQHHELWESLDGTGNAEIMYVDPDFYWGAADVGGRNELGRALMRMRARLRQDSTSRKTSM